MDSPMPVGSKTSDKSQVLFRDAFLPETQRGMNIMADAVGCTMGPKGRTVILNINMQKPYVTSSMLGGN